MRYEQLNALVGDSHTIVSVRDLETKKYVYVNNAYIRAIDRPREEIIGKTLEEVFESETAAIFGSADADAEYHKGQDFVYFSSKVIDPSTGQEREFYGTRVLSTFYGRPCIVSIANEVHPEFGVSETQRALAGLRATMLILQNAVVTNRILESINSSDESS